MTPKETINWCEQFTDNLVMCNVDSKRRTLGLQAMQTIKSALEKQIPKKPIIHGVREDRTVNTISYTCPACNKHIDKDNYCKHCGQALLDWSGGVVARYIDADKLLEEMSVNALPRDAQRLYLAMRGMVRNAPTADVVEVVRCKDCIHWGGVTHGFVCRKFSGIDTKICMGADHFCSYGEMKEVQKNDR